ECPTQHIDESVQRRIAGRGPYGLAPAVEHVDRLGDAIRFLLGAPQHKISLGKPTEASNQVIQAAANLPEQTIANRGGAHIEVAIGEVNVYRKQLAHALLQFVSAIQFAAF